MSTSKTQFSHSLSYAELRPHITLELNPSLFGVQENDYFSPTILFTSHYRLRNDPIKALRQQRQLDSFHFPLLICVVSLSVFSPQCFHMFESHKNTFSSPIIHLSPCIPDSTCIFVCHLVSHDQSMYSLQTLANQIVALMCSQLYPQFFYHTHERENFYSSELLFLLTSKLPQMTSRIYFFVSKSLGSLLSLLYTLNQKYLNEPSYS